MEATSISHGSLEGAPVHILSEPSCFTGGLLSNL